MANWYARLNKLNGNGTEQGPLTSDVRARLDNGANVKELWKQMQSLLGEEKVEEVARKGWEWQKRALSHSISEKSDSPDFPPVQMVESTVGGHSFDFHIKSDDAMSGVEKTSSTLSTMTWTSAGNKELMQDNKEIYVASPAPVHSIDENTSFAGFDPAVQNSPNGNGNKRRRPSYERSMSYYSNKGDNQGDRVYDPVTGKVYRVY